MSRASVQIRDYLDQYGAQIGIFTREQQLRIKRSTVHVAGLGGIGFHVAMFLNEIGVGRITANDPQVVELDNLNRLPFVSENQLGMSKASVLTHSLSGRLHQDIYAVRCRSEHRLAQKLQCEADLTICCSNTYPSRLRCSLTALKARKPLIDAGVCDGRRGYVVSLRIYRPARPAAACPICVNSAGKRTDKSEDRLLGTVTGIAGAMAVQLATEFLVRNRSIETNMINFNIKDLRIDRFAVVKNTKCPACGVTPR